MQKHTNNTSSDTWDGAHYNKNSSLQYNFAMGLLREQTWRGDKIVLDIGCGDGKVTREIAALVPRGSVLGIDASASMLQTAEQAENPPNLKFQLKDAQQLDFDQQFDFVTSFFCLQWVPNKLSAFQGIYRSLKPKGHLLAVMPMVSTLSDAPQKLITDSRWQKYFINYPDPSVAPRDTHYDSYVIQAGLQLSSYQIEPNTIIFPTREATHGWLRGITPHLTRLPNEQEKEAFIQAAVELYLQEAPLAADGSCRFDFTIIKLLAVRV
jgi:trans-aconitate 2-methyltransferase